MRKEAVNLFQTRINPRDLIILAVTLSVAILLLILPPLLRQDGATLSVSTPSGTQSYPLSENRTLNLSVGEYTLTVEILGGRARVLESSCPDGVCRLSGWIGQSGESVICAPAGVRLLVEGGKGGSSDVDFIAG